MRSAGGGTMNPLTKVKLINELNAREAELGVNEAVSWHAEYKDSAWIFIGGLPYELTEGDVICVFSQYGEVVNINLVRDKKTGKSKGFCFLCYEDQRSTILAVDNFNGIKIKGRTIRVDHVANYRPPKDSDDLDEVTKTLHAKGCGVRTPPHSSSDSLSEDDDVPVKKPRAERSRPGRREPSSPAGRRPEEEAQPRVKIKKEKEDPGYERYAGGSQLPGGRAASRTRRDDEEEEEEEEGRRRRPGGRRGGETGSRERRHGEADRSGDRHRRPERPERARSRERRHDERGSAGGSGRC